MGSSAATASLSSSTPFSTLAASLLSSSSSSDASSASSTSTTTDSASTCGSEIVWVEEGPYFVDGQEEISNVVFTQAGIPLNVTMVVLDGRNTTAQQCIPLADVKVDIWNCNWDGVYSDESSEDTTDVIYLRGYQLTNDSGAVLFQTLYPGWYAGRTPHVHFRFRVYDGANDSLSYDETLQVFFNDSTSDYIYNNIYPYTEHPNRDTYNNDSTVYTADNQLTLTGDYINGYQSVLHITIPLGGSTSNYILGDVTNTGNGASSGSGGTSGGSSNTTGGGGGGAGGGAPSGGGIGGGPGNSAGTSGGGGISGGSASSSAGVSTSSGSFPASQSSASSGAAGSQSSTTPVLGLGSSSSAAVTSTAATTSSASSTASGTGAYDYVQVPLVLLDVVKQLVDYMYAMST